MLNFRFYTQSLIVTASSNYIWTCTYFVTHCAIITYLDMVSMHILVQFIQYVTLTHRQYTCHLRTRRISFANSTVTSILRWTRQSHRTSPPFFGLRRFNLFNFSSNQSFLSLSLSLGIVSNRLLYQVVTNCHPPARGHWLVAATRSLDFRLTVAVPWTVRRWTGVGR